MSNHLQLSPECSRKNASLPLKPMFPLLTLETMKNNGYVRRDLSYQISVYLCLVITFTYNYAYEIVIVSACCSLPHLSLFCSKRLVLHVPVQYCIHFQLFTSLLTLVWRKKLQQSTVIRTDLIFIKI